MTKKSDDILKAPPLEVSSAIEQTLQARLENAERVAALVRGRNAALEVELRAWIKWAEPLSGLRERQTYTHERLRALLAQRIISSEQRIAELEENLAITAVPSTKPSLSQDDSDRRERIRHALYEEESDCAFGDAIWMLRTLDSIFPPPPPKAPPTDAELATKLDKAIRNDDPLRAQEVVDLLRARSRK